MIRTLLHVALIGCGIFIFLGFIKALDTRAASSQTNPRVSTVYLYDTGVRRSWRTTHVEWYNHCVSFVDVDTGTRIETSASVSVETPAP